MGIASEQIVKSDQITFIYQHTAQQE